MLRFQSTKVTSQKRKEVAVGDFDGEAMDDDDDDSTEQGEAPVL